MDAARFIGGDVAHKRQQAGMPGPGAEGAMRMKAQHFVDVARQCRDVNPPPFDQVLRR